MGQFDLSFKTLLEKLPLHTLRAFGGRKLPDNATIKLAQREVSVPLKAVDGAAVVTAGREKWVEHIEAEAGVTKVDLWQMRRRGMALELKYDLPVETAMLLMSRRRSPRRPPERIGGKRGTLTAMLEPRYVKLWEVPPDALIEGASADALPWIAAMRSTPEQEERMVREIMSIRDEVLRSRLSAEAVALSALKYDKDKVAEFRQRFQMVSTKDILMASFIGEELVEHGREEGRAAERRERMAADRRYIRLMIQARIPGRIDTAWLDEVNDIDVLTEFLYALAQARTEEEARAAVDKFRR